MKRITTERALHKEQYEQLVKEQNDALSAVDEAINIIEALIRGDVSFAENGSVHKALFIVNQKVKVQDPVDSEFLKTLLQMDSSKFTDMTSAVKVNDLLNQVKKDIITGLDQAHTDEKVSIDRYDEEYKELKKLVKQNERNLIIDGAKLKYTIEFIGSKEEFLETRKKDLNSYQTDLDAENNSYEAFTKWNDQIMYQYDRELSVARDVLQLINNAAFAHYLSRRQTQSLWLEKNSRI